MRNPPLWVLGMYGIEMDSIDMPSEVFVLCAGKAGITVLFRIGRPWHAPVLGI
jgi:hypothetical protein